MDKSISFNISEDCAKKAVVNITIDTLELAQDVILSTLVENGADIQTRHLAGLDQNLQNTIETNLPDLQKRLIPKSVSDFSTIRDNLSKNDCDQSEFQGVRLVGE